MKPDEEHVKRLEREFAQTRQEYDIFQKSPSLLFQERTMKY